MHTNTWTNSNIATIDGCFYITPTLSSDTGSIVFSSTTAASLTGTYSAVTSLYIGDASSGSTVQWTSGSNVLLTGEVEVNGQWLPLGTLLGTLSANATTSSIGLTGLTDNRHNTSSIITDIRNAVSNTSLSYRNLKISLYQRKDGNDSKPLGIYMTAMGANGKTFIDIYGGVNATTTAGSSGGFADPNLRIGNLSGLGAVEGTTPQGWGIYTTNGYFKGVIVSSAGKIGGWSIGANGIFNGITGVTTTGSTEGTFIGTGGISNYKNTDTYVNIQNGVITAKGVNLTGKITASSGSIAGWRIESTYLASGTSTSPAANVLLLSPAGTSSSYTVAGQAKTGWMITAGTTFGVNKDGGVYATNGIIGGFKIDSTAIHTNNVAITSNASNSIALSSADFSRTINGTSRTGLRFAIGSKFGISGDGTLYANGANITSISASNITTGTLDADLIAADSLSVGQIDNLSEEIIEMQKIGNYVTYINQDTGISIHNIGTAGSTEGDYSQSSVQIDSDSVKMFLNNEQILNLGENGNIRIGKEGVNNKNILITSTDVQIKKDEQILAKYGDEIILYNPTDNSEVVTINSSGAFFNGIVNAIGGNFSSSVIIGNRSASAITSDIDDLKINVEKKVNSWIDLDTSGATPIINLGTPDSIIYAVLTNKRFEFRKRNQNGPIAYFGLEDENNDNAESKLYVTNTMSLKQLQFGDWAWYQRKNGNMSIKWKGDEST